jgi:hypothetical protein
LAAVLFVSRRAHEQDIAYTSNFDTLSYVALGLFGLLLLVRAGRRRTRWGEVAAPAAFGLALLCKEAAIVWPAIVTLYGWIFDEARAWRRYLAAWGVAGLWALAYPRILHALYPADQPGFAFDLQPAALLDRYAAYILTFANALVPHVDPEGAGWAMPPDAARLAATSAAIVLTAALAGLTAVLVLAARLRPAAVGTAGRVIAFGLGWFFVATAPFVVFADRLFMRYGYLGHAGLALAIGGLSAGIAERWTRARAARAVAIRKDDGGGSGGEGGIRTPGAG